MKTLTQVYTGELSSAHRPDGAHRRQRPTSSSEMASAIAQLEVGCRALGLALLHGAQARAGGAVDTIKDKLLDTETSVEKLIARVPALGPMVAMSMYRATHTGDTSDGLVTRPSNIDDVPEAVWGSVYPYLDEIGLRTA